MALKLELDLLEHVRDVQGEGIARRINQHLGISVDSVRMITCYTISGVQKSQKQEILDRHILSDPVLHKPAFKPLAADFDWIIEVGFKPGVTDNEGRTAARALQQALTEPGPDIRVYTSRQYLINARLDREQATRIARDLLANELIHRYEIKDHQEWSSRPGFTPVEAKVTGIPSDEVSAVTLEGLSDEDLMQLSREMVLALSLEEMHTIRDYYLDEQVRTIRQNLDLPLQPTDVELECLAQTWSEHCKHKIFNARIDYHNAESGRKSTINSLFDTYIASSTRDIRRQKKDQDFCRSVFKDNAGVIAFDQDLDVCIKVETHNSPSALDPYGGALTGIVGVNRDPMGTGMGADLLCNTDVFCFASPFYDQPLPPRLLHPRRVMEGVREGVEHGGNKSGIPTVNGAVVFEPRYLGKPLVFCGTVGSIPARVGGGPGYQKKARCGDHIVMTGGRIGKDGIHGATFSSEELHSGSPATAVQIGDPITQRKMYDFIIRARDLGLYNAITDNGAGGLSSSVGEMAEDTGGCDLDLSLAPLKYDGLRPWEILLSEAQERMTLAVPPDKLEDFMDLAREMDVEATVLGSFNDHGSFMIRYADRVVGCLDMHFLHHGLSRMHLKAVWNRPDLSSEISADLGDDQAGDLLLDMLSRLNICSREYIIRQYDHEVQGGSVIKPLVGINRDGPGDAAVIRPVLSSEKGLVISNGICPKYSDLDTYWMMANAIDEAVRNNVATGGDMRHMAGVDNFCWCDPVQSPKTPDGHYKLAQLVRANQALAHFCRGYGVPCISGKDSMKNDYMDQDLKISIPPTVLFSVISVIQDINLCLSSDFKSPDQDIYVLGLTRDELGGSELSYQLDMQGGQVPQVDMLSSRLRYHTFHQAASKRLVSACHDLSDGGLGVALAEMAIGGRIGASVDISLVPARPRDLPWWKILYSESAGRFIVTAPIQNRQELQDMFKGQFLARIGCTTGGSELKINMQDRTLCRLDVSRMARAWQKTLDW
ncbi:phosphoribosylformylglycinamidine synthase subunit PurS [Desulfonatronospira sp. MSAO_Bac3]|uniref:phosphoribosylformylglycinamidine synthase subunit PurS n=1 Tax=Desulfonatronospira sp. MSAO_Bac3 TaxID=2293857 RepID=UPI000FF5ED10|nr:phosphoribosylformylglycinamidine synthase subunit PurS [Desulfonatronospira sp. MSAO_Bac3]RQD73823.1 MAG: phosphoribosylformylglycinamidine synthase [Desulfonatronospira sp. MSAO_Bac3]